MKEHYAEFHKKLLAAQKSVGSLSHDARNDFGGFDYTSAEACIKASTKAFTDAGLTCLHSFNIDFDPAAQFPMLKMLMEISDGAYTKEFLFEFPILEMKGKPFDKAVAGADTTCLAYALRGILNFPRPDKDAAEDDISARNDQEYDPPSQPAKKRSSEGWVYHAESDAARLALAKRFKIPSILLADPEVIAETNGMGPEQIKEYVMKNFMFNAEDKEEKG